MRMLPVLLAGCLSLVFCACGDSGGGGGEGSTDGCAEDEVQVEYLGGEEDGTRQCKPIPAACNGAVTCGEDSQDCAFEVYGLCEFDYVGVGCSALEGEATILSCNP
jgi:hypothetical protein